MTLADDLKEILPSIRAKPGELGLRPHRAFLVETTSSGTNAGDGTQTPTETEILEAGQSPKVEQPSDDQLAMGVISSGGLIMGPITPYHDGVGLTLAQYNGDDLTAQTDTLRVRISGPLGNGYYRIKGRRYDKALRWMFPLEPVSDVPT